VNSQVLWDIVVCRQINSLRRSGGVYCLHLQRLSSPKHAMCVYRQINSLRRFGGVYCLHLQRLSSPKHVVCVYRQINSRRSFGGVYCPHLQRLSSPKHAVCVQKRIEQYKHGYLPRSNLPFRLFFPRFIASFFLYTHWHFSTAVSICAQFEITHRKVMQHCTSCYKWTARYTQPTAGTYRFIMLSMHEAPQKLHSATTQSIDW
jgi:hypothetical protein